MWVDDESGGREQTWASAAVGPVRAPEVTRTQAGGAAGRPAATGPGRLNGTCKGRRLRRRHCRVNTVRGQRRALVPGGNAAGAGEVHPVEQAFVPRTEQHRRNRDDISSIRRSRRYTAGSRSRRRPGERLPPGRASRARASAASMPSVTK